MASKLKRAGASRGKRRGLKWTKAHREQCEKFLVETLSFPLFGSRPALFWRWSESFRGESRRSEGAPRYSTLPHRSGARAPVLSVKFVSNPKRGEAVETQDRSKKTQNSLRSDPNV